MKSLSQLRRRLPVVAVVVLAVVGVTAIGFSSKGESAPAMPDLDPFHSQARSPCDERVIVLAPESFLLPRDMNDVLRQRVAVADLPRDLLAEVPVLVELPEPTLRTRLRRALRSFRDRVAVEDRQDAGPLAGYAFDAEECRQ